MNHAPMFTLNKFQFCLAILQDQQQQQQHHYPINNNMVPTISVTPHSPGTKINNILGMLNAHIFSYVVKGLTLLILIFPPHLSNTQKKKQ